MKPREWWIYYREYADGRGGAYLASADGDAPNKEEDIHVIEHSAYAELKQERDAYKEQCEKLAEACERYKVSRKVVAKELDWDAFEAFDETLAEYRKAFPKGES